jgi:hypothetical protein
MAKITLDLNRFKASGVYTIEFDASERIVVSTQTIRLVVGFSRKGPFNAPVFLRDVATSRKVFGAVDSFLEKRGSFFHRALETCLQTAPVFGLNLLPLNNAPVNEGGDAVEYRSFGLAANESNGLVSKALLSSFYNKERFWSPDEDYLQATVDNKPADTGRLFNFVNLGQEVQSVIVRKSENASLYNVTANDYFGRGNVPVYMNDTDYVSDYFVDVYVVRGDWTNLRALSQDPLFSKYFDLRGVIKNRFFEFLGLNDVTLTASFTGAIIPDFIDNNGSNQSIDVIVNSAVAITGIFCNLNKEKFDDYENSKYKVDMLGNSLINTTDDIIDFLSYNTPIKATLTATGLKTLTAAEQATSNTSPVVYFKSYPYGGNSGKFNNVLVIPKPYPSDTTFTVAMYNALVTSLTTNSLIKTEGASTFLNSLMPTDFVKVDNIVDTGSSLEIKLSNPLHGDVNYNSATGYWYGTINTTAANAVPSIANVIAVTDFPAGATAAAGDIILIEAPGYAKYFGVSGAASSSNVTTITVKGTGNIAGANPASKFLDKYGVVGFSADEFTSYQQPSDIKVTLLKTAGATASSLVPKTTITGGATGFNYVLNPDLLYSKVKGLGQTTAYEAAANQVQLYNGADYSTAIAGTWYLYSSNSNTPAYVLSGADLGNCRISNTGTVNPFNGITGNVKVTLPGGQNFYGLIGNTASTISQTAYNLTAAAGLPSIASLATWEAYPGSKLATKVSSNLVIDGDRVKYGVGSSQFNYINVTPGVSRGTDPYTLVAYGLNGASVEQYTSDTLITPADATFADVNNTYIDSAIYTDGSVATNDVAVYSSLAKNISEQINIESTGIYGGGKKFKLNLANSAKLNVGDYVKTVDNKLTRIITKVKTLDILTGLPFYEYTVLLTPGVDIVAGIERITKFSPIELFCDRYQFTKFSGFKLTDYHLPGTPAQLEKIYGVLENTNLSTTLADKDVIQFRYIVDTFNGGLLPGMGPKQYLSRLAMNRQKCLAFLNAPSIAEFVNSTDPRFTEQPDAAAGNPTPVLNTSYIADGGNLSLGPSFTWGLPSEDQGAKFIGVFSPNVIIRENNKNISIPPAADVSNNFIRKFVNGEPFAIVAGPRRGVISNPKFVKMEYDFLLKDRESLEPLGVNPIVTVKNVGPMIFANQTAYQRTLSAFNNLHVRDLLITIEDAIEEILGNYLFEFNDASTRLEIRSIVETYLDTVRNAGGVFNYAVIMDDTNNTDAIIDLNFGILDVAIEPSRGIQKFINRITILKTGTISSGGFSAA